MIYLNLLALSDYSFSITFILLFCHLHTYYTVGAVINHVAVVYYTVVVVNCADGVARNDVRLQQFVFK